MDDDCSVSEELSDEPLPDDELEELPDELESVLEAARAFLNKQIFVYLLF